VSVGQRVAVPRAGLRPSSLYSACSRNGYVSSPPAPRPYVGDAVNLLKACADAVVAEEAYGADATKSDLFAQLSEVETLQHVYRLKKMPWSVIGIVTVRQLMLRGRPSNANRVGPPSRPVRLVSQRVMHSDNTLLANARALSSDWNINNESVVYSLSPLSHNLGFGAMIMTLAVGGQLVIHDMPRSRSLVDRLIKRALPSLLGAHARY
jgi:acyl-CoA synthetase